MGSSGSGRFTDYPGSGSGKAGNEGGGGAASDDRCGKAFSAQLEDVEQCAYFATNSKPPPTGTALTVAIEKRVVAKADGMTVGNLPTRLNYLAACINDGYTYTGKVTASKSGPTVIVSADFAASSA
jgi:hypothetical protein